MVFSDPHLELRKVVKIPPQDEVAFSEMWRFYCAEPSFSNDDSVRLEDHFEKWSKAFVPNFSKNNYLFGFIHRCHRCGEPNPSLSPSFSTVWPNFCGRKFQKLIATYCYLQDLGTFQPHPSDPEKYVAVEDYEDHLYKN